MNLFYYIFVCILLLFGCKQENNLVKDVVATKNKQGIICTNNGCTGKYSGPEFIDGDDVAHQFSNEMSTAVGDKLKEQYALKYYKKVHFENIKMTTIGMGSGMVTFKLSIPFIIVKDSCDAYTSFDHVGGWNHKPALERRKRELKNATLEGHELYISNLNTTPEGLQEYWIQWKNKKTQFHCK